MITPDISLELKMGTPTPKAVPAALAMALRKVEVTRKFQGNSGFSLNFQAERYGTQKGASTDEYELLDTGLLDPFTRVIITVRIGDSKKILMDGYVTQQTVGVSAEGGTNVSLTGDDVSVKMDLFEVSEEHKKGSEKSQTGKKASAIAQFILNKYKPLGIKMKVKAPQNEPVPQKIVHQQETDRQCLVRLAKDYNCIFFIEPGANEGENTAYWGPLAAAGKPQKALTINMGPADNLTSVNVSYNAMAPTLTYGEFLNRQKDQVQELGAGSISQEATPKYFKKDPIDSRFQPLAQRPSDFIKQITDLNVHGKLLKKLKTTGSDQALIKDQTQSETDESVKDVVTVTCELDTALYGAAVEVRGCVDLRGVGKRYDGTYLVREVRHSLSFDVEKWSYTQNVTLVRGGMGTTISQVSKWQ